MDKKDGILILLSVFIIGILFLPWGTSQQVFGQWTAEGTCSGEAVLTCTGDRLVLATEGPLRKVEIDGQATATVPKDTTEPLSVTLEKGGSITLDGKKHVFSHKARVSISGGKITQVELLEAGSYTDAGNTLYSSAGGKEVLTLHKGGMLVEGLSPEKTFEWKEGRLTFKVTPTDAEYVRTLRGDKALQNYVPRTELASLAPGRDLLLCFTEACAKEAGQARRNFIYHADPIKEFLEVGSMIRAAMMRVTIEDQDAIQTLTGEFYPPTTFSLGTFLGRKTISIDIDAPEQGAFFRSLYAIKEGAKVKSAGCVDEKLFIGAKALETKIKDECAVDDMHAIQQQGALYGPRVCRGERCTINRKESLGGQGT